MSPEQETNVFDSTNQNSPITANDGNPLIAANQFVTQDTTYCTCQLMKINMS